jgi:hypothetical protein
MGAMAAANLGGATLVGPPTVISTAWSIVNFCTLAQGKLSVLVNSFSLCLASFLSSLVIA